MMSSKHVVVIGAGTMGSGIAIVFAGGGWRVSVVDPSEQARSTLLSRMQGSMERLGLSLDASRVSAHSQLAEIAWDSVGLVIETALEDLALKQKIFADLEQRAGATVPLLSNSTGYPIDQIAGALKTQQRMMNAHFLMPAQFVPLVELVPGEKTDPALVAEMRTLLRGLGKRPIVVNKPLVGFIANRIQTALMREALSLIDRGIASPEDVDAAVRFSFGFRYAACGPIMQKEHSGWEISYGLYQKVFPELCNDTVPAPVIEKMMAAKHYGMKTGQGFFKWDEQSKAKEVARYEIALARTLEILRAEDTE